MLCVLLEEIEKKYKPNNQIYLSLLYKTLLLTMYFGLFHSCELTVTPSGHTVKVTDVQIGFNKKKFMFILRSSKTHSKGNQPQIIKISSSTSKDGLWEERKSHRSLQLPCPYQLLREYVNARIPYKSNTEKFFVFRDGSPVTAQNLRKIFKSILFSAGFDNKLYSLHSIRSGCAGDLLKLGLSVDTIKKVGRWKSNAVFRYLKYF